MDSSVTMGGKKPNGVGEGWVDDPAVKDMHKLLLQKPWVQFPEPTCVSAICNTSSRDSNRHSYGTYTCTQTKHLYRE